MHVFSISPHLGPLQISLGRMIIDIIKFFFIYMLVLVAFGCGLNQLMWYYADLERKKCYCLPNGAPDWENQEEACFFWRRFAKYIYIFKMNAETDNYDTKLKLACSRRRNRSFGPVSDWSISSRSNWRASRASLDSGVSSCSALTP